MAITKIRFSKGMFLRMGADVILVNMSLITAIILRFAASITFFDHEVFKIKGYSITNENLLSDLENMLNVYKNFGIVLTVICITVFFLGGFYTHGRSYRSRFKALIIFRSVTVSYLILAFFNYMFHWGHSLPRGVWLLGWVTTLVTVGGARLWSTIWRKIVSFESKLGLIPKSNKINNILVIGGAGYLGSVLVRKMLKQNYNVKILDLLMYGDSSIRDLYAYEKRFQVIRGDFRSIDMIVKAMDEIDAVVHLGAIVGDPACQIDHQMTVDINLMSTKMIAEVAKGFGVGRFVFASTCSVYGADDQILTEKSRLNPQSLYAETKISSEKVLQSLGQIGMTTIILRFATLYGLSPRPRFDLVVNLLSAQAVCNGEVTIFGGEQWRPFIHVDDAAEVITKCLGYPFLSDSSNIFNVGSNSQNYQIYQIGEMIKKIQPTVRVLNIKGKIDHRNYKTSFNRISTVLNFQPKHGIQDGIEEICKSFELGLLNDYKNVKYNNYKFLSEDAVFNQFKFDLIPRSNFIKEDLAQRASS